MVKLQESKGRYFVTIPKEYIQLKGWHKGTVLVLTLNEKNNIELIGAEQPKEIKPQLPAGQQKQEETQSNG